MKAEEVATGLQGPGLREPAKAQATLRAIGALLPEPGLAARWLPQLARQVMESCDPDRALNNWERFFHSVGSPGDFLLRLEAAPTMLPALTTLFAASQFLTDMVQQSPDLVEWLGEARHLFTSRTKEAMAQDLRAALEQPAAHGRLPALEDQFRLLRRFKKREVVRIGLRDLLRQADLVETTEDLANLADVCLGGGYEACLRDLMARYGEPRCTDAAGLTCPSEFTVLGLGKLGGQELNFSSDIDLLFLYTADGETTGVAGPDGRVSNQITTHEFFLRLARLLLRAIHDITEEGNVFRVDLRLRPDGRGGPLVNSLHALETYYQYWGKTWERQMLLKARVVAGSERLGRELFRMIHPFIFRKYLDAGALQEIKQIKEQIDRSQEQQRTRRINIKLGWGGIREIEFVAQCFQLVFGGQDSWLQERNTLRALHRISERGYLSYAEYADLTRAYIFFRELEHRIQIAYGRQTHELPAEIEEMAVLARKMGLRGQAPEALATVLQQQYREHTTRVRQVYDRLFYGDFLDVGEDASPAWYTLAAGGESAYALLRSYQFADPEKTYRNLMQLHDGSPSAHASMKSKQFFRQLCGTLLQIASEQPDPDLALNNLEQFVASTPARESLFRLWLDREAILRVVLSLFGNSVFLAKRLIQQPDLLDTLLDPASLTTARARERMREELCTVLSTAPGYDGKLDGLRHFKRAEEFRIGLREIAGEADTLGTMRDLSDLADVCLEAALRIVWGEWAHTLGLADSAAVRGFVIMGLGKLGGRELDFASDLDVLFVSEEADRQQAIPRQFAYNKLGEKLLQALGGMSRYGAAFRVDLGLRPEGQKGPLVASLDGLREYYPYRSQLWERQALLRARPVAGDQALAQRAMHMLEAFVYEAPLAPDVVEKVCAMRQRMESERVTDRDTRRDIKLGYGGLADIEFLVQLYQLVYGGAHPALRLPSTWELLEVLKREGLMSSPHAQTLREGYCFLRRVESALRIVDDRSINQIPESPAEVRRLARRLGYPDLGGERAEERLLADVQARTAAIRALYEELTHALGLRAADQNLTRPGA